MDQHALRELEKRCIQEEPAFCTAACPLHVDARAFVGHMARGDWDAAYQILGKSMPMPGILGRVCDAPCEHFCKRGEAGGAIAIGALERACVEAVRHCPRISPLPAKPKRVAVVGSGLSSLTAAWDLARKGYGVTLFEAEDRLAAPLYRLDPIRLPEAVIQTETAKLSQLGVTVELAFPVTAPETWSGWVRAFDAIYLGLDAVSGDRWNLELEKVFTGGGAKDRFPSPVFQMAEGRWAATSIDRFLQNVSMTAGREKEGPQATGLFTSLVGVQSSPREPMSKPRHGYTREEAGREAGRCLQCACLECVKACVYLEAFKGYPKKYAREIYNNAAIVMGERKANQLINSCSLCGLCERVCPNDFSMGDLCLEARREMVARGKMPPSAHEFALLDLAFSRSERFSLARHEPGRCSSDHAFFPGCQLCASAPDQVAALYGHLCATLTGGVALILGCCGAPAFWAGQEPLFGDTMTELKTQWRDLGEPRLVTACAMCHQLLKNHLTDIPMVSLWRVLDEAPGPIQSPVSITGPLAVHDPCTTRDEPEIRHAVRRLLSRLNVPAQELDWTGDTTECCGYGGLMQTANPDLAREVAIRRGSRNPSDYLTYCAMCRDNLAAVGKRAVHLLDLLFPDPHQKDPAARPRPGWSERQENRSRLKTRLLDRLWHTETMPMEPHRRIRIHMTPEVADRLEQRRILIEDVQRVIHHAEKSGEKLAHPPTGRFKASHTPHKATFWVEYSAGPDGFEVHNAYAHRMEVIGP